MTPRREFIALLGDSEHFRRMTQERWEATSARNRRHVRRIRERRLSLPRVSKWIRSKR
jgi:hypothetical protein